VTFIKGISDDNKERFGIIHHIKFYGINKDAIDNKWVIWVVPATKKFEKVKNYFIRDNIKLGEHRDDKVTLLKKEVQP